MNKYENSASFAGEQDKVDILKNFRNEFLFPQHKGKGVIYFTGNSLGLQPKGAGQALQQEIEDWAKYGVEGHFKARNPWFSYHEMFKALLAEVVGAKNEEVTAMNALTANLHFLMVSFYRPQGKRYKILCESRAFPSDQYAFETQARFHGYDAADAIIELTPRSGEHCMRNEDVIETIRKNADTLALILIGGVNYYTGQLFDMKTIAEEGRKAGAVVGFDLAHAAGNVELKLHDWGVDFAAWCSYKYLNSGPGSVAGIFVHEKYAKVDLPRFGGWWGNDPSTRFRMEKGFVPARGADSWQLSNAPVFSMAVHKVSLDIFHRAGMQALFEKSKRLTAFLRYVIMDICAKSSGLSLEIITPEEEGRHGAQLSLLTGKEGRKIFDELTAAGVIADWREPNVIRMAPVPLYNSFMDVYEFGQILRKAAEK